MKFDLDKHVLGTILTPWQTELMRHIWNTGETDSKTAHNHLQITPHPMSHSTTINFLNKMANEGYLTYTETTTKGGWKRIYKPSTTAPDEESFRKALSQRILEKARKKLEQDTTTNHNINPTCTTPNKAPDQTRYSSVKAEAFPHGWRGHRHSG